jgi:hypothetical protein
MSARKSHVWEKFSRLLVIKQGPPGYKGWSTSICQCDCGNIVTVLNHRLVSGGKKSCGCLHKEIITTHGKSYTRTYRQWAAMLQRCTNPNSTSYHNYGGRGIKVCKRWLKFDEFYKDMGECPPGLSIHRVKKKTSPYEKRNCIYATPKVQARNTSRNIFYTVNGKTACLAELCELFSKNYNTIAARIKQYGWPVEHAFFGKSQWRRNRHPENIFGNSV